MRIAGQDIIETDDSLVFALREPFWGAWKIYKWLDQGIKKQAGFGINLELILEARRKNKKITAVYNAFSYEISPITINNYYKKCVLKPIFKARGNVKLIVVPQDLFKVVKRYNPKEYERKENEREAIRKDKLF